MPKHSNLREYFERGRETQSAFAGRVGIDGGYLSRLINGERVPSLGVALRIAKAARVPVESLLPAPVDTSDSSSADDDAA